MDLKDPKVEWYKILYVESWKQYIHEDTLAHSNNTFYLSANGVLIALLTGIASVLAKFGIILGPLLFGITAILMSVIGLLICRAWKGVNATHRAHIHMRWITARAIESDLNLERVGMASLEHIWRNKKHKGDKFYPFEEDPKLKDHGVILLGKLRGYNSIESVTSWLKVIWLIILIFGMISLIFAVLVLSNQFPSITEFFKKLP